jgi:putative peptidoglycan lipid II flippase
MDNKSGHSSKRRTLPPAGPLTPAPGEGEDSAKAGAESAADDDTVDRVVRKRGLRLPLEATTRNKLAMAAAFLMVATAGSRVLGLVREVIMVKYLGLGNAQGMFTVANKMPNLIRTLLADTALSAAFIPVFSGLLEKRRRDEAWHVAFNVTIMATVVLGAICALGMVFAPWVIRFVAPGEEFKDPGIMAMTAHLTRIMFPTVIMLGIAGVFMGILNSYNRFAAPAVAPIVWNVVIIGVMAGFAGYGVEAVAWGVLAGTALELLIQVFPVWRLRWRRGEDEGPRIHFYRVDGSVAEFGALPMDGRSPWRLDLRNPGVRRVGMLLGPVIISLGIVNFNSLIDTQVASLISVPAPAFIEKAFRLFQLPQGVFAIAIGTVLFPALSRHVAAGRKDEFRADLSHGLRQIFFITLPFAALFAVLALPTVRIVYGYGAARGDEAGLAAVASALRYFSVGMVFVSVNTLLNRAFYSIKMPWLPLFAGVVNLALNLVLDLALYKPLGVGGITLATSLVSTFNFFALMLLLSPRLGGVDARRVAWSAIRSVIAVVPLCGAAYEVWWALDRALGRSTGAQFLAVGLAYLAGAAAYCLAAGALRMHELRDIGDVLRRRRKPRETEIVIDSQGSE